MRAWSRRKSQSPGCVAYWRMAAISSAVSRCPEGTFITRSVRLVAGRRQATPVETAVGDERGECKPLVAVAAEGGRVADPVDVHPGSLWFLARRSRGSCQREEPRAAQAKRLLSPSSSPSELRRAGRPEAGFGARPGTRANAAGCIRLRVSGFCLFWGSYAGPSALLASAVGS
jgi:hypothetical protein